MNEKRMKKMGTSVTLWQVGLLRVVQGGAILNISPVIFSQTIALLTHILHEHCIMVFNTFHHPKRKVMNKQASAEFSPPSPP